MNLEVTILSNLLYNEKYARKVIPFLKVDYFTVRSYKIIFLELHEYISQYDALPSLNALSIECQERTDLTEEQFWEVIDKNRSPHLWEKKMGKWNLINQVSQDE